MWPISISKCSSKARADFNEHFHPFSGRKRAWNPGMHDSARLQKLHVFVFLMRRFSVSFVFTLAAVSIVRGKRSVKTVYLPAAQVTLRCDLSTAGAYWYKNNVPLRFDPSYMLWDLPDLLLFRATFERDSGYYRCRDMEYRLVDQANQIKPTDPIEAPEKNQHQTRVSLSTVALRIPILFAILTAFSVGRVHEIYRQASMNYAKIRYVRKVQRIGR